MTDLPPFMRIGDAAKAVGVEPHVLRFWETEFGAVRRDQQRSKSGQRVYTRRQVEKLILIRQLLHGQGYTVKGAKRALARRWRANEPWPDLPGLSAEMREALTQIRRLTILMLDAHEAIVAGRYGDALAAIDDGLFKEPPLDLSAATTTEEDIKRAMGEAATKADEARKQTDLDGPATGLPQDFLHP